MRKRLIPTDAESPPTGAHWLDLETLAEVEITSEDPENPIERALVLVDPTGWKAAYPGKQTIRLKFDQPLSLRRLRLVFREAQRERTQEFVLRWSGGGTEPSREIVRQQFHFSPAGAVEEVEEYAVSLDGVSVLELDIVPALSGGDAVASVAELRLA